MALAESYTARAWLSDSFAGQALGLGGRQRDCRPRREARIIDRAGIRPNEAGNRRANLIHLLNRTMWRTIVADGETWEIRVIASESEQDDHDILEFRVQEKVATRPPRRFAIARGSAEKMSDDQLRAAYVQARPIGGDFYGRPGKKMSDTSL